MNDKKEIRIAIAGNPNTGKTSLFNVLTGKRQHVGNWPGVTVERKEGEFTHKGYKVNVVDLPGIYGFSAYSIDERVARDFLLHHKVDLVVNVVDAANLERNLYLNLEFYELGMPMIITLNMMDTVREKGLAVEKKVLEEYLGSESVEIVARTGEGVESLKDSVVSCFEGGCRQGSGRFRYRDEVSEEIEIIKEMLMKRTGDEYYMSRRWLAIELLEDEQDVIEKLKDEKWFPEVRDAVEKARKRIAGITGKEAGDHIVEAKFSFLKGVAKEVVKKRTDYTALLDRMNLSDRIDEIITGDILGIPVFLAVMFLTFVLTFEIGNPVAGLIDSGVTTFGDVVSGWMVSSGVNPALISLVVDGIINGVGAVVVFLPNILILFLLIAFLEDTGYMARASFVMDRFMHLIGLHGKSFIPMIIGFGCNVPAIMAARTLETKKDRYLTMLIIPFMSCSARMPVYILFTSAFFREKQALVVFILYFVGILVGLLTVKIFKGVFFKKEEVPLIMEMPPYRMPQLRSLFNQTWYRGKAFLQKAGTVILAGVIVIWMLGSMPFGVDYASGDSLLGMLGKAVSPVFAPAGFGFWQAGVALISGILAKEIVVGSFGAMLGGEGLLAANLGALFTPLSAFSFMIFVVLYIPCLPAIAVAKNESDGKWTFFIIIYTFLAALLISTLVYRTGLLFGFS